MKFLGFFEFLLNLRLGSKYPVCRTTLNRNKRKSMKNKKCKGYLMDHTISPRDAIECMKFGPQRLQVFF